MNRLKGRRLKVSKKKLWFFLILFKKVFLKKNCLFLNIKLMSFFFGKNKEKGSEERGFKVSLGLKKEVFYRYILNKILFKIESFFDSYQCSKS